MIFSPESKPLSPQRARLPTPAPDGSPVVGAERMAVYAGGGGRGAASLDPANSFFLTWLGTIPFLLRVQTPTGRSLSAKGSPDRGEGVEVHPDNQSGQ